MAYSATATVKIIINVGTHSASNGNEPIYVGQEVSSGKYFFMTPSTPVGTTIGSGSTNRQWIYHNLAWATAYNGKGSDPINIDPSLDYSGFMTDEAPSFVDGTYGNIPNVNVVNDAGDRLRTKENTARSIVPFTLFGMVSTVTRLLLLFTIQRFQILEQQVQQVLFRHSQVALQTSLQTTL